ncbi:ABC transporter substrate-binding protein [Rubellimicrobium roseum]|uniref:ABC transporter substrate-binding protein n=1 Tax=Rubellimicrobium roseum TaxID=687525 RepID=A0A5C4NA82_9RHOB|nr:ABC transporter substrate-binding protein [Rubellimicrobium roseum]TNC71751.1 ABC transporter substrate-binding protein [Rubellimicrobium roseum]
MTTRIGRAALIGAALLSTTSIAASAQTREELMEQHRGGTLRLVASAAGGTIDPQINYTAQYWQVMQLVYDGLLTFKKAAGEEGGVVVPDLATEIPEPTNDGKTYVFQLRDGIKFSDGTDVGVDDVVASFQRIFKISGPTSGTFYNGIVGADACLASPADCTLEGGVVGDEAARTVTINLVAPDPEFLLKISVPHAVILPAETPATDAGVNPIPGTGPYYFESYNPNESLVMARNPNFQEWSQDAQPDGYVDRIEYGFGLTDEAQVTAVQNGQADWMFDQPPADRLNEIGTQYAEQVHVNPLTAFWYAPMNTNLPPFDDVRVRQAVNYAIDRAALVQVFGGPVLAQPVCQILPPGFPGHEDSCIYTQSPGTTWTAPDMDKARALVEESGTAGQDVTIVVEDTTVSRGVGTYLQSVLTDLGYNASVNAISSNIQFTYIQNTNNNVQISVSQWYQDYPAASNFLNVLLSCASFHPGSDASINIAGYCNEELDARMQAAMELAVTDPEAANAEWAKIDQAFMEEAPMAPLFTPKAIDFLSTRVGNYVFSNQYKWVMSEAWVQ